MGMAKQKPARKPNPDPTQSALGAIERIIGGPLCGEQKDGNSAKKKRL